MESHVQTLEQLMESSLDHSVHAGSFLRIEEDEQQCSGNVDLDEQILNKLSEQTHRIIELEERLFYYRTYCATLTKQLESLADPRGYQCQDSQQLQELRVGLKMEREEKVQLQDKLAYLQERNAGLEQKEKQLQSKMAQYELKQQQKNIQLERQNRKVRETQARMGERERDTLQLKKKYANVVRINRVLQQQLNQSDRKFIELECFMEVALADKCRHTMRMLHQENQKENQKENHSLPNSQDSVALKPMRQIETKDSVFKEEYLHRARQRQQRLEQLRRGNHALKDQHKKQQNRAQSHEPYRKFT